jgi:hypothetical protein
MTISDLYREKRLRFDSYYDALHWVGMVLYSVRKLPYIFLMMQEAAERGTTTFIFNLF